MAETDRGAKGQAQRFERSIDNASMIAARDTAREAIQPAIDLLADAVARKPFAVGDVFVSRMRRALTFLLSARDELS
jgi:hypothetical protein